MHIFKKGVFESGGGNVPTPLSLETKKLRSIEGCPPCCSPYQKSAYLIIQVINDIFITTFVYLMNFLCLLSSIYINPLRCLVPAFGRT